jgi:protein-disulfide isomerase
VRHQTSIFAAGSVTHTRTDYQPIGKRPTSVQLVSSVLLALFLANTAYGQFTSTAAAKPSDSGPIDRAAVERIIEEYLLTKPEIIRQASAALERREAEEKQARTVKALQSSEQALNATATDTVLGNPKGDVTVVEFMDYRCGYCKRANETVNALIASDPNVRVVIKQMPVLGAESLVAARSAMAALKQGKYPEFHRGLFALETVNQESANALAKSLSLDMTQFAQDLVSEATNAHLDAVYKLADSLAINGTPAFVVRGQLIPGAIDLAALTGLVAIARAK